MSLYLYGRFGSHFLPPLIENFCKTSKNDPFLALLKNPSINKAIQRAYSCPPFGKVFYFCGKRQEVLRRALPQALKCPSTYMGISAAVSCPPLDERFFFYMENDTREIRQVSPVPLKNYV